MIQYLHAGDVEHESHQPEQQLDSGGSRLPTHVVSSQAVETRHERSKHGWSQEAVIPNVEDHEHWDFAVDFQFKFMYLRILTI
jgi:hypothetical protein